MPPTFPIALFLAGYLPVLLVFALVGVALLPAQRTRPFGRRVLWSALATAPALAVGFVVAGAGATASASLLSLALRHWTNSPDNGLAIAVLAYGFLFIVLLAALLVGIAFIFGARVGWLLGSGLSFNRALATALPIMHLVTWTTLRLLAPKPPLAAQQGIGPDGHASR